MPPDTYGLVDRVLGGGLDGYLTSLRNRGLSYEAIARQLATDHDISVTGETVRRWFMRDTTEVAS